MKKIAFIIPWIGKLPNHFQLWLNTCQSNNTVDFLLFIDDKRMFDFPQNVKVIYTNIDELKELFQKNFDFTINLDRPYKLCDYRPAYGEIFKDYIRQYDFWGHCDIDIFWGNIRQFVTDEILNKYNRIYSHGHCSLYSNTEEVNSWYRCLPKCQYQNWRKVFSTERSCFYDEWGEHCGGGISFIIKANKIDVYDVVDMADLNRKTVNFKLVGRKDLDEYKDIYFKYENGHLFIMNSRKIVCECIYVHFQKRTLKIKKTRKNSFYLLAPDIVAEQEKTYILHKYIFMLKKKIKSFISHK